MTQYDSTTDRTVRRLRNSGLADVAWIAPGVLAGLVIYYVYLETHPYPAFGAGLFLFMAEQISQHGYGLPEQVPFYATDGIPVAYPPLGFYLAAAIMDITGADAITVSRFLPGLLTVLYLVPTYLIGRELLESKSQAGFATFLVAVSPPVLQWHISAGGIVRALAFLMAVSGAYTGLRLFRERDRNWILPSLLFFALTVLSHPLYTLFFVLTYLVLYVSYDRTLRGLVNGAAVGFGALVVTAPWWGQVMLAHGWDVFFSASGTHGGIGLDVTEFVRMFEHRFHETLLLAVWNIFPLIAIVYLLRDRRYFLPLWFVATGIITGKARLVFFVGAFAITPLLFDIVEPALRRFSSSLPIRRAGTVLVVVLAVLALGTGTMYASSQLESHNGSASLPMFIDDGDVDAMEWVNDETPESATFVVAGDSAEWFPYLAQRTILVGPWGVEWKGSERYEQELWRYRSISTCSDADCITQSLAEWDINPDYVYVPTRTYTVRGMEYTFSETELNTFYDSDRYQVVFENEDVLILEVVDEPNRQSHSRIEIGVR